MSYSGPIMSFSPHQEFGIYRKSINIIEQITHYQIIRVAQGISRFHEIVNQTEAENFCCLP